MPAWFAQWMRLLWPSYSVSRLTCLLPRSFTAWFSPPGIVEGINYKENLSFIEEVIHRQVIIILNLVIPAFTYVKLQLLRYPSVVRHFTNSTFDVLAVAHPRRSIRQGLQISLRTVLSGLFVTSFNHFLILVLSGPIRWLGVLCCTF